MISPLIPADDFARQLPFDELATLVDVEARSGRLAVCSLLLDNAPSLFNELTRSRADSLMRELTQFLRRNLRGSDAIAVRGEELVIMVASTAAGSASVAERLVSAARAHHFLASATDRPVRVTLRIGLATSPEHGTSLASLLSAARGAGVATHPDSVAVAFASSDATLDLHRFVGRTETLAVFSDYLDDMMRGTGRVVAIIGEMGVGTSAFVHTMEPEIRLRGGSLVVGTCRRHLLPSPYALWSDLLHAVRRLPVKSTRRWQELASLDSTLEHGGEHASRGGSKTQLLEELADFLRLAAQQRPLVVLLENLEWADAASWDALEYLVTQLESERIILALTFRAGGEDDALERWSRFANRPRHHEIRLSHLTRDDVKRYLESVMRTTELAREIVSYVYRQSEGNPLVLMHLLRDLAEGGHIAHLDGAWHWGALAELPPAVPLEDLVSRRLARLSPAARAVVDAAAVLGRESEESLLLDIAHDASPSRDSLQRVVEAGFLVPTYDRERAAYVVAHDEIARVARERLIPDRAKALHARAARALAVTRGGGASEIAGHFEKAEDRMQAHRYALRAADDALAVHETGAVAELLAVAERTAPNDAALAEVRVRMASLAEVAGQYEDAEALCDLALAWYEGQGDQVQALTVKRTRALVRMKRGQGASETLSELLDLEAEASKANADMERAAVLLLIAQLHWRLGDLRAAQRVAGEAVGIAERGTDQVLLADACNRFAVTIQLENPARARELFERALEICTALGDAYRRVRGLNNIGVLEINNYNWDEARRVLVVAVEQARTAGIIESWGRAELNLGVLAGRIGDYADAKRAFTEALRLTSLVQNSEEQLYATYNLAHLERDHDRLREAADTFELVVELAERIGQVPIQAGAFAGLGLCLLDLQDFERARDALKKGRMLSERLGEWFQGRELIEGLTIHLLIRDGELSRAIELLQFSLELADASDISGAAWLIAEFGMALRPHVPDTVEAAIERYRSLPEVLGNPKLARRFDVLKRDTSSPIDRIEPVADT